MKRRRDREKAVHQKGGGVVAGDAPQPDSQRHPSREAARDPFRPVPLGLIAAPQKAFGLRDARVPAVFPFGRVDVAGVIKNEGARRQDEVQEEKKRSAAAARRIALAARIRSGIYGESFATSWKDG